jgi:hypothetical protein
MSCRRLRIVKVTPEAAESAPARAQHAAPLRGVPRSAIMGPPAVGRWGGPGLPIQSRAGRNPRRHEIRSQKLQNFISFRINGLAAGGGRKLGGRRVPFRQISMVGRRIGNGRKPGSWAAPSATARGASSSTRCGGIILLPPGHFGGSCPGGHFPTSPADRETYNACPLA